MPLITRSRGLQVTLTEAYDTYHLALPEGCKRSTFYALVPYWVKKPKSTTCNCIYHSKAQLLIQSFRHAMLEQHKDCECNCAFCHNGNCKDTL